MPKYIRFFGTFWNKSNNLKQLNFLFCYIYNFHNSYFMIFVSLWIFVFLYIILYIYYIYTYRGHVVETPSACCWDTQNMLLNTRRS